MKTKNSPISLIAMALGAALTLAAATSAPAQSRGLKAIRTADLRKHLEFLAAPEFAGRPAPSPEVDIASLYIALEARRIGLKPLLPDGSYLQYFPVKVMSVAPEKSRLRLITANAQMTFDFPRSFAPAARSGGEEGTVSGELVFLGTQLNPPVEGWSALTLPDLNGKVAVILDAPPAAGSTRPTIGPGPLAAVPEPLSQGEGSPGPRDRDPAGERKGPFAPGHHGVRGDDVRENDLPRYRDGLRGIRRHAGGFAPGSAAAALSLGRRTPRRRGRHPGRAARRDRVDVRRRVGERRSRQGHGRPDARDRDLLRLAPVEDPERRRLAPGRRSES